MTLPLIRAVGKVEGRRDMKAITVLLAGDVNRTSHDDNVIATRSYSLLCEVLLATTTIILHGSVMSLNQYKSI